MERRAVDNRELARIAVFAALVIVGGLVSIPVGTVPITLQTLAVLLAGAVLGPVHGALSVCVVLVLAAAGLPVLAGGTGGLAEFVSPSGGYLFGFVLGAVLVGAVMRAGARVASAAGRSPVSWPVTLVACLAGEVGIYALGIPWTAMATGLTLGETLVSALIFLPGDALKIALAVAAVQLLWRAYPAAFPQALRGQTGTRESRAA